MSRLKPSLSVALVLAFLAGLGGAIWSLQRARQQAGRAVANLQQKIAEREWLAKQSPALNAENEQAIAAELVQAGRTLADLRDSLKGRDADWLDAPPPARPLDAFFDIASFVEKTRAATAQAKVGFVPDEHFGFAAYANEGPPPELVPAVFRQRLLVQRLVETLIEARPLALLGLRREPVAAAQSVAKNVAGDFFTFDRALSLRQPGQLDTMAFRLEFSGQTSTLRNFLNSLAAFPQPFVVRSVEVEPLPAAGPAPAPVVGAAVPLVRQNLSKFAVVVEFVLLNPAPAPAAP
jgi:hypothetical protein